ncbi:hypothetical protein FHX08_006209 [Rhizobium sp. BK529]|uniref:hypothetical protein n=1 Tax=unclassified Rhizobium TaxID=2613769 RepID=UPI001050039F|nr:MULTISPECIES: hypothetical protein [unclassified Rhizobium]MBB3595792.1 hypothetical protein [Rhizobium sp. BK529]TCR95183.1 hypothetical protein EV281_11359 [Rhizobium sp. BK418]
MSKIRKQHLSGKSLLFLLGLGLLLVGPQAAVGQVDSTRQQPDCQADSQPSIKKDRQAEDDGKESDTSRCKGVLTPPPTGDRGMVETPPPTGDMPVIRPGETPQQAPQPKQQ